MADVATLEARLTAAETAWHELMIGQTVQLASVDGRAVTYTPADRAALSAYILDLKAQLGRGPRRSYPVRF